jgi:hypothetical protein
MIIQKPGDTYQPTAILGRKPFFLKTAVGDSPRSSLIYGRIEMADKKVIGGTFFTAPQIKEICDMVDAGIINRSFVQAIIEHRNPWVGHSIVIDRSAPFRPSVFFKPGWTIWRGPIQGDGLVGSEALGGSSLAFTEIDFDRVFFETCLLPDETHISGEEKIIRHAELGHVCGDAKIGPELLNEKGQKTLLYLLKEKGIEYFELSDTVLRSPRGQRYTLYLYWAPRERQWGWSYEWLNRERGADRPSLVLAKE